MDCVLHPETFLYLVVSSTWDTQFRSLDQDIKHTGFKEIRKPNTAINNKLHDRRQDLVNLQEQVKLAKDWMPQSVGDQLVAIRAAARKEPTYIGLPNQRLQSILERSMSLERFLMDSFKLLISSTSVLEAELATQQGIRAQRLTSLAFVYVPLSFVTGIFGMNVKEINGSPLSVWVVVVAIGVTVVLTAAILVVYARWEKSQIRSPAAVSRYIAMWRRTPKRQQQL